MTEVPSDIEQRVGTEEFSRHRKAAILATCCISLLIVSMDATIVNVALPSIRTDLDASTSNLQWVIDAYTLVLASLLVVSGAMADRFGRRRVFQAGLVIFAVGSFACSLAPDIDILIGARALQAIGGSMLNPVAMSIITQVFVEPRERARAVGIWGAVIGIAMGVGPVVGGVMIEFIGWPAIFWINVPICAIALILTALVIPRFGSSASRAIDSTGQLLGIVTLAGLIYGLIEAPRSGWTSTTTVAAFVVAAIAFIGFLRWERRCDEPFIDLRFFASIPFSSATVIAVCAFASYGAFLFLISLYLQSVRGFSPVSTGLMLLPVATTTLICSPISGRLVGRFGTRLPLVIGGAVLTIAGLALTTLGVRTPIPLLLIVFAAFGVGFSMMNAPITTSAVSGMPRNRAGAASAIASTSRQIGISLGVAIVGTLTGSITTHEGTHFVNSTHTMWWVVTGLGLVIVALGIWSSTASSLRGAQEVASRLIETQPQRR